MSRCCTCDEPRVAQNEQGARYCLKCGHWWDLRYGSKPERGAEHPAVVVRGPYGGVGDRLMVAGLGKPSMVGIGMVAVICDTAAAALPAVRKENTNAWITEPPRRPLTQDDLDRLERARLKRERKAARKAANR